MQHRLQNVYLVVHCKGHGTPTNSTVESGQVGPVGVCVIGLQLDFLLYSSLISDCLVGSRPLYNSTLELD